MTIFTALNEAVLQVQRFRILLGEACSCRFQMTLKGQVNFDAYIVEKELVWTSLNLHWCSWYFVYGLHI